MGRQIGIFFLVVGMIVVFVFATSVQAKTPDFALCLVGFGSTMLGALLIYKFRRKRDPANRFRMINKMRNRKNKTE